MLTGTFFFLPPQRLCSHSTFSGVEDQEPFPSVALVLYRFCLVVGSRDVRAHRWSVGVDYGKVFPAFFSEILEMGAEFFSLVDRISALWCP